MSEIKIALLQLMPCDTAEETLQKGLCYCEKAARAGADIALFPEMFSCGYTIPADIEELRSLAVPADGAFVSSFAAAAERLEIAVAVTFLESFDPLPRNSMVLFDRKGRRLLSYSKVHTCDFGDEIRLTPGEQFPTARLNTASGELTVGAMICYDREFPESARLLMLSGAELILVPNACPMEQNRLAQLRARAFENMLAIATVNYPDGKEDCNGHSTLFDGIAYDDTDSLSRDMLVAEAPCGECMTIASFDLTRLREYRRTEVHGNAYRRPHCYHRLISEKIDEPFVRSDSRR